MINNKIVLHIYGPALSNSGYGVACRQIVDYCLSDERFIVLLENVPWGNCEYIHENTLMDKSKIRSYYECMARYEEAKQQQIQLDVSIYCTIPNEFKRRAQVCIGATAGIEVDRITRAWIAACNQMDFIIVPSQFSKNVLTQTVYTVQDKQTGETKQEKIIKEVRVIPHWFEKPGVIKQLPLDFSTSKNLLFVGMWGNKGSYGEDRKNVSNLIRYFYETFHDQSDVGLILKTEIVLHSEEDLFYTKQKIQQIKDNFKDAKCKVHLIHDSLSEEDMYALYHHPKVTGFITLTHGEGFCLPALEAAASGLPVLATGWSGYLDFLKEKNGFLEISFDMKEIPECQVWENVIDKGSMWAEPDTFSVKKRMKKFITSPAPIQQLAKQYSLNELNDKFSKIAVMRQWKEFFNSFIVESSSSNLTNEESVSSFKQRKKEEIEKLEQKFKIEKSDREKVLYVMPMSFGDIVISTCIVDSLVKNRHHDCDFYFATKKDYFEVLDGLVETHGIKVIEYDDILINAEATREIWDYVYTPGINVQYNFSNWTLGNGKFGLNLFQEFAKNCNLTPLDITDYNLSLKECAIPSKNYVCLTAVSSKDSKTYKHWNDIIKNIKDMCPGMEVVQFGTKGENKLEGTLDYRGLTWNECLYVLKNSIAHIGPDTGMGHAAAALDVPHLVLFASTSPNQCAPQLINQTNLQLLIEPEENLCGKCHCYKDICVNKKGGINCISNIDPQTVCEALYLLFNKINDKIENPQKYAKLPVLNEAAFKDALKVIGDLKNVNNNQSQA